MKNFFRNHYGFILGFITGVAYLSFCIEAYKPIKNPLIYIGSLGLTVLCNGIYRKLKKDAADSSNPPKKQPEKSF